MRQISRIDFVLLVAWMSFCFAPNLQAQTGKSGQRPAPADTKVPTQKAPPLGGNGTKPSAVPVRQVPPAEDPVEEDLPPELIEILKRWETESSKIKNLHGTQTRSEFNHTFETEKVTKGPFFLETPDKGRIDMLKISLKEGAISKATNKAKEPYALETDKSTRWICTGDAILEINEEERTYERMEIPANQRGTNIVHTPLPFLFGMKADEAKRRFKLTLKSESADYATLLVVPRMEKDRQNYKMAKITLEKKRYLPKQVRMLDDSGLEIVYTFESVVVNDSEFKAKVQGFFKSEKDPYHPNLKNYTLVIPSENPPDLPPVRQAGGKDQSKPANSTAAPNSGRRTTPPANATGPGTGSIKK